MRTAPEEKTLMRQGMLRLGLVSSVGAVAERAVADSYGDPPDRIVRSRGLGAEISGP